MRNVPCHARPCRRVSQDSRNSARACAYRVTVAAAAISIFRNYLDFATIKSRTIFRHRDSHEDANRWREERRKSSRRQLSPKTPRVKCHEEPLNSYDSQMLIRSIELLRTSIL
ncbi:hypothetical protein CAJAP_03725 [Camponotus japonicus]